MVRIHREPPMEGPPARGSGLYPLRRQISAARQVRLLHPLPIFRAGSSTDQNSWPTPNRCGFNSRTAHHAGSARRSSPRSIIARRWFDSNILHHFYCVAGVTGRNGRCTRLLSETRLVRFQRHPPDFTGTSLRDWQIWICTRLLSETKWVRFPHPAPGVNIAKRRHSITEQCAELLPRTMRVQISLPLPMCGDVVQRMRAQGYELGLRNMRSEFTSLYPSTLVRLAWSKA